MKDELISLEVAKLAKEKGFDWRCLDYYEDGKLVSPEYDYGDPWMNFNDFIPTSISAPTQSLLQRWLREVHQTEVFLDTFLSPQPREYSVKVWKRGEYYKLDHYPTYEKALEEGLKHSLNLL